MSSYSVDVCRRLQLRRPGNVLAAPHADGAVGQPARDHLPTPCLRLPSSCIFMAYGLSAEYNKCLAESVRNRSSGHTPTLHRRSEAMAARSAGKMSLGGETVSNPEDEAPLSDDTGLPDDDLMAAEPSDASAPLDQGAFEEPETEDDPKKGRKKKKEKKRGEKKGKEKKKKEKRQSEPARDKDSQKSGGLLHALSQANPFTVMLGLALLALIIAVYCLYKELDRYDFDIKAKKGQPTVAMARLTSVQFGPAKTSEAA